MKYNPPYNHPFITLNVLGAVSVQEVMTDTRLYAIHAKEMFVMPTQRESKKLYVMNAIFRNTYNFFYNLSIYYFFCILNENPKNNM